MAPTASLSSRSSLDPIRRGLQHLAFVFVVSLIAAVGSERMFWFWSTGLDEHLFVSAFYSVATAVTLWAIDRYRVSTWWSLWLASPLFALVVEGVITPVTYSGGPFVPIFPVWFAFWHGVLAFGVFWGAWSTTLWLPENVEVPELVADQGEALQVLDPGDFALYAALFTAVIVVGHAALGRVRPASFAPARLTVRVGGGLVLLGAAIWTVAIPWALPMFLAYGGLQIWGLRRHEQIASGPTLLERLEGPTPVRPLLSLTVMAPAAAATYTLLWESGFSHDAARALMWSTIAVQTIAGFVITVMVLRRAGRGADDAGDQSVVSAVETRSTSST